MYTYESIYYSLGYWIFGYESYEISANITNNQELVLSFFSAFICLFVLALPFLIVWWAIKRFL